MKARIRALAFLLTIGSCATWLHAESPSFSYLAWNPSAALSFFPMDFVSRSILPVVLADQEAGLAFAYGCYRNGSFGELRVSVGNSNHYYLAAQAQAGWSWFLAEGRGSIEKGPYAGVSLRYWDLIQLYNGTQTHNLAPLAELGWWFDFKRWFVDVRLSQTFCVASLSSLPHASAGFSFAFSPMTGISSWMPIGLVQVGIKF
jgi:hypothetical protein